MDLLPTSDAIQQRLSRPSYSHLAVGALTFCELCLKVFGLSAQVQQQQRDYAKQLAYGLLYGKGPHALAADLSCTVQKAAEHQDSFLKSIPAVVSC